MAYIGAYISYCLRVSFFLVMPATNKCNCFAAVQVTQADCNPPELCPHLDLYWYDHTIYNARVNPSYSPSAACVVDLPLSTKKNDYRLAILPPIITHTYKLRKTHLALSSLSICQLMCYICIFIRNSPFLLPS